MSNLLIQPRYFRSRDDPRVCRYRAKPGAVEAASGLDVRRYHGRRSRRLERLEGAVAAHALSRNRAAGRRRSYANAAKRAHRTGASRITQCLVGLAGQEIDAFIDRHYPNYWLRTDLATQLTHAQVVRDADAVAHEARHDGQDRFIHSDHGADDFCAKPCAASGTFCRVLCSGRRQYRGRRTSRPPVTAMRSTRSCSTVSFRRTKTSCGAPTAFPVPSNAAQRSRSAPGAAGTAAAHECARR